jgi:outer membrane immunogenic protein
MDWPKTSVASGTASAISGAAHGRHRDSSRRARGPRAGLAALALILLAPAGAVAADMPDFLRGSFTPSSSRWDGFYVGGQLGWSSATVNYSNSLSSLTGYILRDSVLESGVTSLRTMGRESPNHNNYGAFLGYNFQLADQLVLGVEANYTHLGLESSAADTIERIFNNDTGAPSGHHYYYDTTVTGSASVRIKDFATMRARAGYEIGQFLPYAFGGLAIGRVDYFRSATVGYTTQDKPDTSIPPITPDPPPPLSPVSKTDAQSNAIAYGFAAGLGVDVSILPNVFLRAEWEYVQFAPIHDIQVGVNSGRVGIGVKF